MNPDKRQTMNGKRSAKFWMAKFKLAIKHPRTTGKTALTLLMVLLLITPTYLALPGYFNSDDPVELKADDAPPTEGRTRGGRVHGTRQSPQRGVENESIETQMGEAAEALTPWRAKGENSASLGLGQSEASDYAQQVTALVGFNPFQLATGYGETDLRRGIDPTFAAKVTVSLTRGESAEQHVAIVLPVLPNQLSMEQHLKDAGAKVLYPVTPHGYAVKASSQVMANLSADSMVYAIAQRPSQMKFDPTLAHELGMASPNFTPGDEKSAEKGKANLQIFDTEDRATVKAAIESLGVKIDRYDEQIRVFKLSGITAAAMRRLSQMPEVGAITSENEHKVEMDEAVSAVNHTGPRNNGFEDDNGVIIGMIDSGMQFNHTAFAGRGVYTGVYGLAWNVSGEGAVTNDNSSGHGTHVAGIMLSRWYDYWSFPWTFRDLRGMAPHAGNSADRRFRVVRCGKDSDNGRSINNTEQAMDILKNDNQALVINNSWGSNDASGTNSDSIKADQVTWDTQQIYVFAAGNDGTTAGTINSPAAAKNVIAVGGTDKSKNIYASSSEGPTGDGRMKPDIYAPGVDIRSADAANTGSYTYMTGTSMAAPVVTGFLSTLLGHYTSFQRRPALAKAVMIATAERRSGLQSHTGVLDSENTHWATAAGWKRWGWTDSDVRGQDYVHWDMDNVPSGVREMRVVLTWIEPAPELNAAKAVLSDVDLYVDHNKDNTGGGGDWYSWSGNDNVEVITITNPPAGNFRIKAYKYSASADYRLGMAVYFKK